MRFLPSRSSRNPNPTKTQARGPNPNRPTQLHELGLLKALLETQIPQKFKLNIESKFRPQKLESKFITRKIYPLTHALSTDRCGTQYASHGVSYHLALLETQARGPNPNRPTQVHELGLLTALLETQIPQKSKLNIESKFRPQKLESKFITRKIYPLTHALSTDRLVVIISVFVIDCRRVFFTPQR
ncbi:30S ribosomal protein S11 [Striga asiatica]|uniref:30S ribosomal protein S11 n=1 Tax=Striga asiatica TaxID=4170 RepID=A0A5A7PHL3_STRAF|nr:30S ribosomal protein S11 [Striga asiatica]